MDINANSVKELREKTGAGMMDCKKALMETQGRVEEAVEWLRKKGLAAAAKKAGRIAAEGLIGVEVQGNIGAIIELNSETDFVAKNNQFQDLVKCLVHDFISFNGDIEQFKSSDCKKTGKKNSEEIAEHIAVIGENMALRRAERISVNNGTVTSYVHNSIAPGLGKIGVLVGFETNIDTHKVAALGRQIAMHIAATKPESLSVADLDASLVAKEKEVLKEQAKSSGKPENVIEKMVEGRLIKFYEQVVLLEQIFVVDGKTRISEVLMTFAKENNGEIKIKEFVRFALGEGIEKEEKDFAQEVAEARGN